MRVNYSGAPSLCTTCSNSQVLASHRLTFYPWSSCLPRGFSLHFLGSTWLRSLGQCIPRAEVKGGYVERALQCASAFLDTLWCTQMQVSGTLITPGIPFYTQMSWGGGKELHSHPVHVCFLMGEDHSAGDAFVMFTVVFLGPALPNV